MLYDLFYRHNAESRLKSETTGGTTVNYVFNGLGQRVQKTGGATATYTLADDAIDSEVLNDGAAIYAHGVSGILSENRGGTSKFYHADALGSVRALTNSSGTVTDSKSTDAFGLVVTSSGSTPTPFGFAGSHGYQQDSETGLMRLGHRMYDASTGRFISRDPILYGYNWYAYCDNDPTSKYDAKGLFPFTLPANPTGLPPGWGHNPIHTPGNGGGQWIAPGGGGGLEFHPGIPGKTGEKGHDHWHIIKPGKPRGDDGKPTWVKEDPHYEPGEIVEIPDPLRVVTPMYPVTDPRFIPIGEPSSGHLIIVGLPVIVGAIVGGPVVGIIGGIGHIIKPLIPRLPFLVPLVQKALVTTH